VTATDLARLHMPVLVVVGDQDFVGDAQELVAALPNGHHRVLVRTDHFATPGSFGFIDSMLDFLASETA
jgi:pimeloyl-ACP methyl ester carboxylesterase